MSYTGRPIMENFKTKLNLISPNGLYGEQYVEQNMTKYQSNVSSKSWLILILDYKPMICENFKRMK